MELRSKIETMWTSTLGLRAWSQACATSAPDLGVFWCTFSTNSVKRSMNQYFVLWGVSEANQKNHIGLYVGFQFVAVHFTACGKKQSGDINPTKK